jgi:hypothetical protein
MNTHTLTLEDVAARLSMEPRQFAGKRGALYRVGFPRPLPACGNRWSARLVDAWIDAGGQFEVQRESAAPSHALEDLIESDRRALNERYLTTT